MIRNAPLHLVTDRADGEVRSSVDQAHTCPAASPGGLYSFRSSPEKDFFNTIGTKPTCRLSQRMSVHRDRPEVTGESGKRRF
jgi:hypothetical protein